MNTFFLCVYLLQIVVIIEWKLIDTNKIEQVCVKFSVKVV